MEEVKTILDSIIKEFTELTNRNDYDEWDIKDKISLLVIIEKAERLRENIVRQLQHKEK